MWARVIGILQKFLRKAVGGDAELPARLEQGGELVRAIPLLGEDVLEENGDLLRPQRRHQHQRGCGRRLKVLEIGSQLRVAGGGRCVRIFCCNSAIGKDSVIQVQC